MSNPPGATALKTAAIEIERHVATAGWDQPPRLFALVPTRELRPDQPGGPDGELSAVEQEWTDDGDLEGALARLAWPPAVLGVALALERLVVPPEAEADLPTDPEAALAALARHPGRRDVRLLAATMRSGERICLLRQRAHDDDHLVGTGPDLAPGLLTALAATLAD